MISKRKKQQMGYLKLWKRIPSHHIMGNIAFVDQESNWSRWKIKESIYINAMDRLKNQVIKKIVMKKARI